MSGILTRPSGLIKPAVGVAYAVAVAADTPLAWYRLGEASGATMVDSSGNARDGVYTNAPRLADPSLIAGDTDTSTSFRAANLERANSSSNAALYPKDFVHELWVKNPGTQVLMRDGTSTGSTGYFLDLGASNATFISLRTSGTTVTTTYAHAGLRDGAKHHLVWRVQGTVLDLWVDNVKVHTSTITAAASRTAPASTWTLAKNGTAAQFIDVNADEWAIYTALSDTRVGVHYAAGH